MKIIFYLFLSSLSYKVLAQKIVVSGKIIDKETGEKIEGVTCSDGLSNNMVFSNSDGYFSFNSLDSILNLNFTYVGYNSISKKFKESGYYTIELRKGLDLEEVIINSEARSFTKIDISAIKNLPSFLGETDVMKVLQFQPGVQGGTDGSASVFVRGGGTDQNLVLWDDALIYNVNHLAGFFSIFNPNVVKNINFYKSYIPPKYGGRGSSVIAIDTKEGNKQDFEADFDIGIINQNLTYQGPIKENKSSFIISGRYSNLGIISGIRDAISKKNTDLSNISFYDFSARVNSNIGKNGQIIYSIFFGKDKYQIKEYYVGRINKDDLSWKNFASTISYSTPLGNKFFFKSILSQTSYKSLMSFRETYKETNTDNLDQINNKINDLSFKFNFEYVPTSYFNINFGSEFIRHKFRPSYLNEETNSTEVSIDSNLIVTKEIGLYCEPELNIKNKLILNAGVRNSHLFSNSQNFSNWEPRLNLKYNIVKNFSVNIAAGIMNQYMHSLSSTGSGFNLELWVPATSNVAPLQVKSASAGYSLKNLKSFNFSQEFYIKRFKNLIAYREGENITIFQENDWYNKIYNNGIGKSWGLENNLNFSRPKFDFNLSYTLSRTDYQFSKINQGKWYPFKFDRRHYFTTNGNYKLNKKWDIAGAFVLQSGQAFTAPVGVSTNGRGSTTFFYTSINNARFPLYHRLDLSFSYHKLTKRENPAVWSFGAFNIYNRKNPGYLDVDRSSLPGGFSYNIISKNFLPIVPFIKYSVSF